MSSEPHEPQSVMSNSEERKIRDLEMQIADANRTIGDLRDRDSL